MGIYIPNMKMPKSCEDCPLVEETENFFGDIMSRVCNLIYKGYTSEATKGRRRYDCPLVPLPEKHGRLIDADALQKSVLSQCEMVDAFGVPEMSQIAELIKNGLTQEVGNAETIIEAEGGGEQC